MSKDEFWTDEEIEVFKILKTKCFLPNGDVDMDSAIGIVLELHINKSAKKMLRFLKTTPHATEEDIFDFLDVML